MKTTKVYDDAYNKLNPEQRLAVDTIEGPLLVLAGPGTGKTQILSARVACILQKTDISASNILCLTFTESGAANMRERLISFMGDEAYDVTISTYHSFGNEIIKKYREYFEHIAVDRTEDIRLERPIDELTQTKIVVDTIDQLPFDSILLGARYYVGSVVQTISDLKQHLINPVQLKAIAKCNLEQIDAAQLSIDEIINKAFGISRKKTEWINQYSTLLNNLSILKGDLVEQAVLALKQAYDQFEELNSSKPLTVWKNAWLHKNEDDKFTLTRRADSEKMFELASVYESYEQALKKDALYDFDDMILRAIGGITSNDELRYNLQERYQYILLDEFQDTNPAQFELVKKLTDHPVHEGRPNIMAVGDDDQAIFAFQGARVGNLQDFLDSFKDVVVINLTHNYRSHSDILHVATNIASQIKDRVSNLLKDQGINKILLASSSSLPRASTIARHEFQAESAEFSWVARKISALVESGVSPSEIAVLTPKHKILENLVPFLNQKSIPISYERRENILETEIVCGLRLVAQLLQSLEDHNMALSNQYFPRVLSLPYWQIPALDIWRANWQFGKHNESRSWAQVALDNQSLACAVEYYLSLSTHLTTEPLEVILDECILPLKDYYFSKEKRHVDSLKFYESISHLSVIRTQLRSYQDSSNHQLRLSDFLDFFDMYEAAGSVLINTHPIAQGKNSVQLMTAYKAKGLEFDYVFILQAHDDIWGNASRGLSNKLSLPPNLDHIRYASVGDDERLRLFFVAISRARHGLFITSHSQKENGKPTIPLKYLSESDGISAYLPLHSQKIIPTLLSQDELMESIATLWSAGRVALPTDFRDLLSERLARYVMSPTHLNTFMDLEYGGPEEFLMRTLLRFPSAPTTSGEYGVAIHNTLEWYQSEISKGLLPSIDATLVHYEDDLTHRYLIDQDQVRVREKGRVVLQKYLSARSEMLKVSAQVEVDFSSDSVVMNGVRLTGKIDRLEVDKANKKLTIVDFKTSTALPRWNSSANAYKYKHQLYFYKFLLEGSSAWSGYTVAGARLEFVEPTDLKSGVIQPPLVIQFDDKEEQDIKQLIKVVWDKIQTLDLPKVDKYSKDISGTKEFELDLLSTFN